MYEGNTRKPIIAMLNTTAATKMKPRIVKPFCPCAVRISISHQRMPLPMRLKAKLLISSQLNQMKNASAADVVIGHEAPVAAVVAVVAVVSHHEVLAGGHLAAESTVIVNAVLLAGKRSHVERINRLRCRIDGDGVIPVARVLDALLGRDVGEPFEVAIGAVGRLRQRHAVDRQLLVKIVDLVAGQADHPLDEVLRRIDRVTEDDDVAALRVAGRDDLLLDDRQADAVGELVDQDEIAHFKRGPHRRTRDLERLDDKRAQQKHDQQDREETLRILDPPGLGRVRSAAAWRIPSGRPGQWRR